MLRDRVVFARRLTATVAATVFVAVLVTGSSASADPTWLARQRLSGQEDGGTPAVDVNPRGDAVVAWLGYDGTEQRVFVAYRKAGGAWGPGSAVSSRGPSVTTRGVAIDRFGNAAVVWREEGQPDRLRAAVRQTSGAWSSTSTLSAVDAEVGNSLIGFDNAGNALAIWEQVRGGRMQVQAASRPKDGAWGRPFSVVDVPGENYLSLSDLEVDGRGNFSALWTERVGDQRRVMIATGPAVGPWHEPSQLAIGGWDTGRPRLAVNDAGHMVAVWEQQVDGVVRAHASIRPAGGSWAASQVLSYDGQRTDVADVGVDSAGNSVAVWRVRGVDWDHVTIQASTLWAGGLWDRPVTLSDTARTAQHPRVAVDSAGNATAVWYDYANGNFRSPQVQAAHRPADADWRPRETVEHWLGPNPDPEIDVDSYGNALAVWRFWGEVSDTTEASDLDVAGPVTTMSQPFTTRQTATSFQVAWSAADWSTVVSKDVRFRAALWNGGFGEPGSWQSETTADSVVFDGTAGTTYCFSARARDSLSHLGTWSAERCAATPVDDRTLTRTSSWTRGASSSFYLGTYTSTKTKGASLTRTGLRAKHVSLLVTTCRTCGQVKVSFNGTTLGTYSLTSSTTVRKKLISVKTFDSVQTGTLKIQVVSSTGRSVYLDGVIARQS